MAIEYQLMIVKEDGRILSAGYSDMTGNSNWNEAEMEVIFPELILPYDLTTYRVYWDSENSSYVLGAEIPQIDPLTDFLALPKTLDKVLRVSVERTEGSRFTPITPNWCDKRTWYFQSVKKTAQILTHISNYQVYQSPTANVVWIDNYHGLYSNENDLTTEAGDIPRLKVYVNDVLKTEQDTHYSYCESLWNSAIEYHKYDGCYYNSKAWKCLQRHTNQAPSEGAYWAEFTTGSGDFCVDYKTGTVTFKVPLTDTDVVKVDVWEAGSSCWKIKPIVGKKIKILYSEVQFSLDIGIRDTVKFQLFGLVEIFAPQYCPTPYPEGTLIPLANPVVYKTRMDFINEADGAYPTVKANNTDPGWRNLQEDVDTFPFQYQAVLEVIPGMEIRVWLEHDQVFDGTVATATFYGISYDND